MNQIQNDQQMREQLGTLSQSQLRQVAAQFTQHVLDATDDEQVKVALDVAARDEASDDEIIWAYKLARSAAVESHTRCGADCNWEDQAAHFVAKAASSTLAPGGKGEAFDMPWQVANQCRMARNCLMLANTNDAENPEAETQYKILNEFLQAKV